MSVPLTGIRNTLRPGLYEFTESYRSLRHLENLFIPAKPHIWVPKLTLPQCANRRTRPLSDT